MIIGVLPNASTAETLLNNLDEADFDLASVSVILKDLKLRDAIAKDTGPLKGVTLQTLPAKLAQLGISPSDVKAYTDAVARGQVLVAINPPQQAAAAAKEMFQDVKAQFVKG